MCVLCHLPPCREEKRVAGVLQSQMAEIKQREEEAAQMEREQAGLLREQAELEKLVSAATATVPREPSLSADCFFLSSSCNAIEHHLRRRRGNKTKRKERKWSWGELLSSCGLYPPVLVDQ